MKRRRALAWIAVGIVVGLGCYVYTSYRRDLDVQRTRVSTGGAVAHTPCGSIEYAVAGDGAPVLVIHAAGGGFDQGIELAEGLSRRIETTMSACGRRRLARRVAISMSRECRRTSLGNGVSEMFR